MTAGAAAARFLAEHEPAANRAYVIGSAALHGEVQAAGFELLSPMNARQADVVVVGGHEGFDYRELRAATWAVHAGAKLFATGRDPVVPTPTGPQPATGAVLAAVEAASGATATVIGKPARYMFDAARSVLADCRRIAVVGDNLMTDVAGARRAGLDAILVLSGCTSDAELERAGTQVEPDLVVRSLAELVGGDSARDEQPMGE
jgi:HAD superfamily hydrolase (TIGR01450 family)